MLMFKENPVDAYGWVVDSIQFIDERSDERVKVSLSGIYKEGMTYNLSALDNMNLYIEDRMNGREGEVKMDKILNEIYRKMINNTHSVSRITRYTSIPQIENVIFNPPATIVFWTDGTKTVVKCQNKEAFDTEKGITMAFFKKAHGNKGHYFEEIKEWTKNYVNKEETEDYDPCESCIWLDSDK